MKKNYTTPTIEKIAFRYRDQVVAASGTTGTKCTSGNFIGQVDRPQFFGGTCDIIGWNNEPN